MRVGQRHILCLLMFTGLITNYMMRINISIAIVKMAESSDNSTVSPCSDNTKYHDDVDKNITIFTDDAGTERPGFSDLINQKKEVNVVKANSEDDSYLGWSGGEVSWVLTAFFIGYAAFQAVIIASIRLIEKITLIQMAGGRLAEKFGTRKVFGISNAGKSL